MPTTDPMIVTQRLIPAQMPIFTCNLSAHTEALRLAREAIDDLRAADPNPLTSNVKSVYVSPYSSQYLTPKFGPLSEIILHIARHVSKTFLSANMEALGLDYFVKDCWGIIYEQADHTIPHNHYPAELSCSLYLEAEPNCAPLGFDNGFSVQPEPGLLVMFPGILTHYVPPTPGRRVVVAMNMFKKAHAKLLAPKSESSD
ncbi:MAG: hypothetical protein WCO60_03455 [Verrucomicrobiota bacterium]